MKNLPIDAKVSVLIDEEDDKFNSTNRKSSVDNCSFNRKFSVKSAYHLAREGVRKNWGESSDTSVMQRF